MGNEIEVYVGAFAVFRKDFRHGVAHPLYECVKRAGFKGYRYIVIFGDPYPVNKTV